jgi:phosphohistidine phosphatase
MKKLVLIRHAKSSWDQPWQDDHDRPLAERGLKDAVEMAKRLKKKGIFPDCILSSSALRAVQTATITAEELGVPHDKIKIEKTLFHASPNILLKWIHMQKDSYQTLFVIGHNPGLNELIKSLGMDIENLPTSGQFGFSLKMISWSELNPENVRFWYLDYPKKKH